MIAEIAVMPKCNCCGRTLPLEGFHRDKDLLRGRRYTCRQCAQLRAKQSRERLNAETSGLYGILRSMKRRCYDAQHKSYPRYGRRGITICPAWLSNPDAFYAWAMQHGYRPGLQIDRINNDGNYCPSNCQWVQPVVNVRNNTNTKLDTEKVVAIRKCLRDRRPQREIARMFGVGPTTISHIATGQAWSDIT